MSFDPIGVVEAAYDLDTTDVVGWLDGLREAAQPILGGPGRAWVVRYEIEPGGWTIRESSFSHSAMARLACAFANRTPAGDKRHWIRQTTKHGSWFRAMAPVNPALARWWGKQRWPIPGVDIRYTQCLDGGDQMVLLGELTAELATVDPGRERLWLELAAHVSAGLRLRSSLGRRVLDGRHAEAVLDGAFRVVHAREPAQEASVRQVLRDAARGRDRARTRGVRAAGGEEALTLWRGLVDGRWSLVDCFDTDGKRFHVAVRNDPDVPPRITRLSERERQVARMAGQGMGHAEIAYALGVGESGVGNALTRALRKLRLRHRTELPWVVEATARRLPGPEHVAVAATSWDEAALARLTTAERAVARHVVAGDSDRAIAAARGTALRTIANQVRAISRKLGVSGRLEIVRALIAVSSSPSSEAAEDAEAPTAGT